MCIQGCLLLQGVFSVMLNGYLIYQCFTPQAQNSLVLNSLQKNLIILQKNCASLFDEWQMCLQLPTVDVPQLSHLPSPFSSRCPVAGTVREAVSPHIRHCAVSSPSSVQVAGMTVSVYLCHSAFCFCLIYMSVFAFLKGRVKAR